MSTTPSTTKTVTDVLSQLSIVLPTGTFFVFQIVAPLATNNGMCGKPEIVVTSLTLILFCLLCGAACFTDSYKAENGVVYYGFVTRVGLWNPNFRHAMIADCEGCYYIGGGIKYIRELDDYVNAVLSVMALATVSLLTEPVTTCFYPNIPGSIQKSVPLLVGLVVAAVCAFGTTPRNGIGFATAPPGTPVGMPQGTPQGTPAGMPQGMPPGRRRTSQGATGDATEDATR